MKACKLEKRADGVIRWLERMKKSYRSGAVESAYMDAECARADLEVLRSDVFAGLAPKPGGMKHPAMLRGLRVIGLAALMVMMTFAPLSRESLNVAAVIETEAPGIVASVRGTEERSPVASARGTEAPSAPATDTKPSKPRRVQSAKTAKASQPKQSSQPQPPKPKADPVKSVAYDKVYSLVQTGQRALKNDKSVVKLKGVAPNK